MTASLVLKAARCRALVIALFVLACATLAVLIVRRGRPAPLAPAAVTIVPGVHLLGGLSPSAAYVVETSDGLVLVDSGLDADAGRLKAQMKALGLDWRRVRAILLTHAHGDHTGGAAYLRAVTGAKVYAGRGDAAVIRAGGPFDAVFSTFDMPPGLAHATSVDVELDGNELIRVGGVRVRVIATPGHTPGSVCYLMEREGLRALFAGDVIMMLAGDEHPRDEFRKPLGTYSAYLAPRYRGNAGDFLVSLRILRNLPVPDLVLPGHPAADRALESPELSPRRWEALLDRGISDMQTLVARYQRDGADFLDGNPKELLPRFYYLGERDGAAVYAFVASSRLVVIDAPGGPGLAGFLAERLSRFGREPCAPAVVLLTACGRNETAGLAELVATCNPTIVAPASGIARLKQALPRATLLAADQLPAQGWFDVAPVAVRGRGAAPVAYRIRWSGREVLVSGRIPIKANAETGTALFADFAAGRADVPAYLDTVRELRVFTPDLWLPAVPTEGQNANLYDSDWRRILDENTIVIRNNLGAIKASASR